MSQKKPSKRYREAAKKVDREKRYTLPEAITLLKGLPAPKFDPTISLSLRMGVDPRQSDQMVRGTCPLPHGSGKSVRVVVFATGQTATAAEEAGAEFVGFEDLIKKCQEGWADFDVAIATPAAMAEVRKLGRVLGPRGLMPNPKTGTVTDDVAAAIQEVKAGRVEFKLDKNGNISVPVGKASFADTALVENGTAVVQAIAKAKPAGTKGVYIQNVTLSATMLPGVNLETSELLNN